MSSDGDGNLTHLLEAARGGDHVAVQHVWERVQPELHRMAVRQIAQDGIRAVLQPTSMVAELYIRMVGPGRGNQWANHRHFFAAAAEGLRRVRVDRARTHKAAKRGGGVEPVELHDEFARAGESEDWTDLVDLDEALDRLAREHPQAAEVAKLRYFGSYSREEIALMLEISPRTVDSEWRFAKCWLFDAMGGEGRR